MKPLLPWVLVMALVACRTGSEAPAAGSVKDAVLASAAPTVDRRHELPPRTHGGFSEGTGSIRRAPEIHPPLSVPPTPGFSFADYSGPGFTFSQTSSPEPPLPPGKRLLEWVDGEPYVGSATTRR